MNDGVTRTGKGMLTLFWIGILALGTVLFSGVLGGDDDPNGRVAGTVTGETAEVRLEANASGHYVATGTINGEPAPMLLDTGATTVVVPESLADRYGLERGARIPVETANGRATVRATRIDRLTLGPLEFRDVRAAIAPGLEGRILLGMSALGAVEFTQRDGELVIRQTR